MRIHRGVVLPEWIDINGHMNVAYYVLAFDHATDAFFDYIGLDSAYREATTRRPSRWRAMSATSGSCTKAT